MKKTFEICGILEMRWNASGKWAEKMCDVFSQVVSGAVETGNDRSEWYVRFVSFR